jgi:hypothetical protein
VELREHTEGGYRFLATSPRAPYSAGVVALPGHEIVHATLRRPVPVADGFTLIERHLRALGRPRAALCGVELRGAAPYTPEEWIAPDGFNERYRTILREWGLFVDGFPAVARTNVVPVVRPPAEQVFHAFSYTVPLPHPQQPQHNEPAAEAAAGAAPPRSTFVTSGGPEDQAMWDSDASVDERLLSCLDAIGRAVTALGHTWDGATAIDVYLREGISTALAQAVLERIGGAAGRGLHWYLTKTPLIGPYLEADARGVRLEVLVDG